MAGILAWAGSRVEGRERRTGGWPLGGEQRIRLRSHLKDNPSLKAKMDEALAEVWELAVIGAARETGMPEAAFPAVPAYPFDRAVDDALWPE